MLDAFPIYHWFHNGNPYSGAEGGMRYVITPIKVPDPSDESGKKKREALCAEVWPGPSPGCMSVTPPRQTAGRTSRRSSTVSRTADD